MTTAIIGVGMFLIGFVIGNWRGRLREHRIWLPLMERSKSIYNDQQAIIDSWKKIVDAMEARQVEAGEEWKL